jgi:hypothetical protein
MINWQRRAKQEDAALFTAFGCLAIMFFGYAIGSERVMTVAAVIEAVALLGLLIT